MNVLKYFLLDLLFASSVMMIYLLIDVYTEEGSITYIGVLVTLAGLVGVLFVYKIVSKLQSRLDSIPENLGVFLNILAFAIVITFGINHCIGIILNLFVIFKVACLYKKRKRVLKGARFLFSLFQ